MSEVGRPSPGNLPARPSHKRKSLMRYGWYTVLGILAIVVGAALGLAV